MQNLVSSAGCLLLIKTEKQRVKSDTSCCCSLGVLFLVTLTHFSFTLYFLLGGACGGAAEGTHPLSVPMFPVQRHKGFSPSQQTMSERRSRTGSVHHRAGAAVIALSPSIPRIQDSENKSCNHFWVTLHAPLNDHMCSETKIFSPRSCVWVAVLYMAGKTTHQWISAQRTEVKVLFRGLKRNKLLPRQLERRRQCRREKEGIERGIVGDLSSRRSNKATH